MPSIINVNRRQDLMPRPRNLRRPPLNSMSQIPNELLERLLGFAITSDDDYEPSHFHLRYKTLSTIRCVSRHWNQIILSMTSLWHRIAIDVSSSSSRYPPPSIVNRWIQRSNSSQTLEILISMPSDQNSTTRYAYVQAIIRVLTPHMRRWGELWFHSEVGVLGFPPDLSEAYNLTKLSIDAGILDDEAIETVGPVLNEFPGTIRDLCLEVATFDWMFLLERSFDVSLDGLERLRLQYEGWMQGILNIFSDTRSSLVWANIYVDGQWSSCSTEYHTLDKNGRHISHATLQYLKLEIYDADLGVFEYLDMAALGVLDISVNWSSIPEETRNIVPLIDFIENKTPSLRTCTMKFDKLQSNWTTLVFRSPVLSRLRTYKIRNVKLEKETVARFASSNIADRLRWIEEANQGRYTAGWVDYISE